MEAIVRGINFTVRVFRLILFFDIVNRFELGSESNRKTGEKRDSN